jgi:hypothetical protein
MTNVDDAIRKALRAENEDLLKDLAEPGIFSRMLIAMRQGPRWTTVYVMAMSGALTVAAIWFAVRFFSATEIREMIAWATGFLAALLMVAMLKLWFWLQMEKYVILREMKRLELQVARLAEREGGGKMAGK